MNRILVFFSLLIIVCASCSTNDEQYNPKNIISKPQEDSILLNIIKYTDEHRPDSINLENRFEKKNEAFFKGILNKYSLDYLYKDKDGTYYYFIYKVARGVDDMYVGIGGKFKLGPDNQLQDFEESFRMWRMLHKDLKAKGVEVYADFINNKTLDKYMNNEKIQYIEFPNDFVGYDKNKKEWVATKLR